MRGSSPRRFAKLPRLRLDDVGQTHRCAPIARAGGAAAAAAPRADAQRRGALRPRRRRRSRRPSCPRDADAAWPRRARSRRGGGSDGDARRDLGRDRGACACERGMDAATRSVFRSLTLERDDADRTRRGAPLPGALHRRTAWARRPQVQRSSSIGLIAASRSSAGRSSVARELALVDNGRALEKIKAPPLRGAESSSCARSIGRNFGLRVCCSRRGRPQVLTLARRCTASPRERDLARHARAIRRRRSSPRRSSTARNCSAHAPLVAVVSELALRGAQRRRGGLFIYFWGSTRLEKNRRARRVSAADRAEARGRRRRWRLVSNPVARRGAGP